VRPVWQPPPLVSYTAPTHLFDFLYHILMIIYLGTSLQLRWQLCAV